MQIIRRHQQLQAQLRRYLHIRHIARVFILQVVVEVLAYFFQDDTTTQFQLGTSLLYINMRRKGRTWEEGREGLLDRA